MIIPCTLRAQASLTSADMTDQHVRVAIHRRVDPIRQRMLRPPRTHGGGASAVWVGGEVTA